MSNRECKQKLQVKLHRAPFKLYKAFSAYLELLSDIKQHSCPNLTLLTNSKLFLSVFILEKKTFSMLKTVITLFILQCKKEMYEIDALSNFSLMYFIISF